MKHANELIFWTAVAATFVILGTCLSDETNSEAKNKSPALQQEVFQNFSDSGMLVNGEGRSYVLELGQKHSVSFQVTGNGGNVNCAVYDSAAKQIQLDESKQDGCSIVFVPETLGRHTFVIHNASEDVERFSASVIY